MPIIVVNLDKMRMISSTRINVRQSPLSAGFTTPRQHGGIQGAVLRIHAVPPDKVNKVLQESPEERKKRHEEGDLHYGLHDSRSVRTEIFKIILAIRQACNTFFNPKDPETIDNLNCLAKVEDHFRTSGRGMIASYFSLIQILKGETPENPSKSEEKFVKEMAEIRTLVESGEELTIPQSWLLFLSENINKLSFDNEIAAMEAYHSSTDQQRKEKFGHDPLSKSIGTLDKPEDQEALRKAIIEIYQNKGVYNKDDYPEHIRHKVIEWVYNAFFKRTSNLGIDFTLKENRVIHFNLLSPYDKKENNVVNDIQQHDPTNVEFITHSELKHINETYGVDHPQIDIYLYPSQDGNGNNVVLRYEGLGKIEGFEAYLKENINEALGLSVEVVNESADVSVDQAVENSTGVDHRKGNNITLKP